MTTTTESLWPSDFGEIDTKSPVAILKEQGAQLGRLTKNILTGEVTLTASNRVNNPFMSELEKSSHKLGKVFIKPSSYAQDTISFNFNLKASALQDYRYVLFVIEYDIAKCYPLKFHLTDGKYTNIKDETEFQEALKEIFASDRTKKVIQSLLAQSTTVKDSN